MRFTALNKEIPFRTYSGRTQRSATTPRSTMTYCSAITYCSATTVFRIAFASLLLALPLGTWAQQDAPTDAQVYQEVGVLMKEIEQVRQVLGIRMPRERAFELSNVEPRQVFFQAQTLFRKCNTLAREVAGISREAAPRVPEGEIGPEHVMDVVRASRRQVAHVKQTLGIGEPAEQPRFERRRNAGDVMHDIIEAGYILNELTEEARDWPQIYDRVYQAVTYLGGTLPEDQRYPELDAFECCKMPQAVYARLLQTMESLRPLAAKNNLQLIRVKSIKQAEGGANPGTVYDLTTTLVSDIGELTLRLDGGDVSGPAYPRPARIYPSHVYQLASALEKQAALLVKKD